MEIDRIASILREFAEERDWDQFHSPKNLAMALSAEAGELLEVFQWLTEAQSINLDAKKRSEASDELADIVIYSIRMADKLGVDLGQAVIDKIRTNGVKYPVEKSKGNARKYTEFE